MKHCIPPQMLRDYTYQEQREEEVLSGKGLCSKYRSRLCRSREDRFQVAVHELKAKKCIEDIKKKEKREHC